MTTSSAGSTPAHEVGSGGGECGGGSSTNTCSSSSWHGDAAASRSDTRGSRQTSTTGTRSASETGSERSYSGRARLLAMTIPPSNTPQIDHSDSAGSSPQTTHRDVMSIAHLTGDSPIEATARDASGPRRLSRSMPDTGFMPAFVASAASPRDADMIRERSQPHESRRATYDRESLRFSPMSRTQDLVLPEGSPGLRSARYNSPTQANLTLPSLPRLTAFDSTRSLPLISTAADRPRLGNPLSATESMRTLPRPDALGRPAQISPPMTGSPGSATFKVPEDPASAFKVPPLQPASSFTDAQMQAAGFTSSAPITPLPSASSGTFSSRSSKDSGIALPPPAYKLVCRQQPQHARMCGFGEKDRRPLDPPPILEVFQIDRHGNPATRVSRDALLTVHVTLWDETGTRERSLLVSQAAAPRRKSGPSIDSAMQDIQLPPAHTVPEVPVFSQASARGDRLTRVLMGSLVANPSYLKDEHDRDCALFILPDLSVRTEGRYRLRFSLFKLELSDLLSPGARSNVLAECMTDVFTVYPAKTFPGMLKSTELTRAVARQGFKVQIRNDVRPKKNPPSTSTAMAGPSGSIAEANTNQEDTTMTDQ